MHLLRASSIGRLATGIGLAIAAAPLLAASGLDYKLDVPPNRMIAYTIDLEVLHPGLLALEADWAGTRVLSFRLVGPSSSTPFRRSGPPPLRAEVLVRPQDVGAWQLRIRGLPSREAAPGTLRVELPEKPGAAEATGSPETPPSDTVEPWTRAVKVPAGLAPELAALHASVERFRALVIDEDDDVPDKCLWQHDFLRYLVDRRDAPAAERTPTAPATRKMLRGMAEVVALVEGLRTTDDPILIEPDPDDRERRRALSALRRRRTEPIRDALDTVFGNLQNGHAPELQSAGWPVRFMSCLTTCERHFEERHRLGEAGAPHRQLAADQWDRILAAADALSRLLDSEP